MKRAYKGLIAAALSIVLVMSLVVTSWAGGAAVANAVMSDIVQRVLKYTFTPTTVNDGEDEIVEAMNYINSVWRTAGNCTGTVEVTYQTMSDLVVDLNMNGVPCQIAMWRGSGATGYVIKGTGKTPVCGGVIKVDITGKYFTNTVGAAFLAKSKSEITTPDTSTTTPTTPTINFDDTNIVNAVEGVFDQLTWVIRCQFEQMQDTLLNGRILLNINDLVSKNVIPFLEDILVADTATSSTLQALYQSFENKFSDLDTMFGTDTSMQVHSGDLLTWDNMSRGFISATADGTTNTVRLTPAKTLDGYNIGWSDDGYFTITPVSGVFPEKLNVGSGIVTMPKISSDEVVTVPNPDLNEHVPSGYTQYSRYTPYSTTPLDLGIAPQTNMEFRCAISAQDTATSPTIPQYFFGVDGLYMAISQDQKAVEVCSGSTVYRRSLDFSKYGYSAYVVWRFGESWRETLSAAPISTGTFPATTKTLYLGQANGLKNTVWIQQPSGGSKASVNYAFSRYGRIDILDTTLPEEQGNLMYQFVPCKRDSDGVAGMYRVSYTNGAYSSGTFIPCGCEDTSSCADYHLSDQIPLTKETTVKTAVDVVRLYRDSGNFWHAVGADGSDLSFDATSAVALLKAFPVYEYNSVDAITSLPDGNYTMTWSGTAQTVTINYQAYSKFFAYIANQITYNRNWLDERLDHLSVGTPAEPTDLTPVLEGINSVTTAQAEMMNSLSAFLTSFNSKFSDLDSDFGSDGLLDIQNGGVLAWDNASKGFTEATAVGGSVSDLRFAPLGVLEGGNVGWDEEGRFTVTAADGGYLLDSFTVGGETISMPDSALYDTVTSVIPVDTRVPDEYTQYAGFTTKRIVTSVPLGVIPARGVCFSGLFTVSANTFNAFNGSIMSLGASGHSFFRVNLTKQLGKTDQFSITALDEGIDLSCGNSQFGVENSISLCIGKSVTINSVFHTLSGQPEDSDTKFCIGGVSSSTLPRVYWRNVSVSADGVDYTYIPCEDASGTLGVYRVSSSGGGEFIAAQIGQNSDFSLSEADLLPKTVEQRIAKPGNIVRMYREAADEWYAVGADGVVYAFDAAVSAKLEQAFPVYQYTSLDALTSLPDGNYRVSWSGDASAISIKYQTYSKFFVYLSNQLTYNRNWLDKRLGQLSFSAGDVTVSPTDLTDVVGRMDTIIDLLQNTSGDAACEHTYEQDMTTDATCTLPGLMVSTCTQCGDSYSEIVDPLGHDWKCTDHVAAVTDPETGEETAAAYDIYTCSRCGDTYNDYSGEGAPEDHSNTSISRLIVELFSRLGKLVGSLVAFVVNAFDKALTSVDNIISKFNSYTEQITGFGGTYPAWLGGLWGILPADLQVALTFAVVCMAVALVGKKLVFS